MSDPETDPPRPHILLVEDDLPLLEAFTRALTADDTHEVTACGTFEEARRRLREQTFDVLMTDVRLGAFNGLQLAVLAKDVNPRTQVIVFSGFDDHVLRTETEHLGGVYLVKPVTVAQLRALMSSYRP
jgi:two-component system, NtrC family, response regulator HydG